MSTKVIKRKSVRFGNYEIAIADVIRVAQEDGSGTGWTVGLVTTKAGRDKYSLLPFARVLELNGIDRLSCSTFNPFTKVWRNERAAAEAVRKFCERFAVSEGERTQELLSTEENNQKVERTKKSTAEKVEGALKTAKSRGAYVEIANVSLVELMGAIDSLAVGNIDAARAVIEEMAKFVNAFNEKHPATAAQK